MKHIRFFLLLFFFAIANATLGQNLLGFVNSNYAGVIGTYQNPSSISNSKLKLDVNVFTFGGHLQNNYYFIPRSTYNSINPFNNGFADFKAYQGYNINKKRNYLYTKEQMHLPSVMYSDGKKAFGFHISWRFESDTKNAPNDVVRCLYEGMFEGKNTIQELNTVKHADKFHFAVASWEELGCTYSKTIVNDGQKYVSAGVTGNLLLGNAAYYYNNKKIDYYFEDTTSISFNDMYADFGGVKPTGLINGLGVGIDLGITYCMGDSAENENNKSGYYYYKYKFGAAILDLGEIRYGNGKKYSINSYAETTNLDANKLDDIFNLNNQIEGVKTKDHLNFYLPTALSLQFDYNINNQMFISANFIHNLRFTGSQIRRPTILAVTPRYEKRWLEISMPLSIYDWRLPRIGFEIRVYNMVFGTEKVGWLFKFQNYSGVDGYISLRYNIGKKINKSAKLLF